MQRVFVHQGSVFYPVCDGVVLLGGLYYERFLGVEVQPPHHWQGVAAVAEVYANLLGRLPFGLDEVSVGERNGECAQHDVVGIEVRVARPDYRVDAQRVAPDGVLPYVGAARGAYRVGVEGHHLALLAVHVVAVGVLQGIGAVGARRHSLDHEVPAAVGSRHPEQRRGGECGVRQVGIQPDEYALDWLEVAGVDHIARHFERVDALSRRETVGVVAHRVAFVVVGDGV